ncbi:MAG: polysulfide reductase NrfD [Myxococcaceae bacterium]|nr:polysulfide reductase NrfD [Myxococcaceae bacterium]
MATEHAHAAAADPLAGVPVLLGNHTDETLTDTLFGHVWRKPGFGWYALFGLALAGFGLFVLAIAVTLYKGIGAWGNNIPVGWAFGIINFVWWIGIGHAGTLISAILLLFQQKWRTSINRFAEAMTIFAVIQALVFPVIHTGRPWYAAYFLFPYPSTNSIWPQFKSPLMWDVFAVSTYFTISLLFWFMGLIPDLASLRDRSKGKLQKIVYGILSLGWRGSGKHWHNWKVAYLIMAGISTPLVLSVHSVVSFDFAVALLPGWHATIFPPYFVAGAVFSGFAMVVTWIVPARRFLGLKDVITMRHLENMNKIILVTGLIVSYGYLMEHFIAWYSGNEYEWSVFVNRATGPYAGVYWLMITCNVVTPNLFWFKKIRTSIPAMWILSILVNIGMWCERFIIIVTSLHRGFVPSTWEMYYPTWVDFTLFAGTIGFFSTLFLLFMRFLPAVATAEVKEARHEMEIGHVHHHPGLMKAGLPEGHAAH